MTPGKRGAGPEAARLRAMARHPIAKRTAAALRGVDIAGYRDDRLRVVSGASVRRELVVLAHVFEIARKEWGVALANPVRDIRRPPNGRPRVRRLRAEDNEASRLMAACAEARNRLLLPLVELALETAMRRGELLALRWEHVTLARRTAYLPDTKNGEARAVPLSSRAIEVLTALGPRRAGSVFAGLTPEAVKQAFRRAARRANLVDFRFHDLRHEATTRLFERGLELMEVASITGHKDPRMLRRYTHLNAERLARKLG
ncbi:MAG: site-specific integrase [Gammaproteobacteria bacterium]